MTLWHIGELLYVLAALLGSVWFARKVIVKLRCLDLSVLGATNAARANLEISRQILQKVQTPPPGPSEGVARIDIPIGPVSEQR